MNVTYANVIAVIETMEGSIMPDRNLGKALSHWRNVSLIKRRVKAMHTNDKRAFVDAQTLATRWGVSLEQAKRTLEATEQRAV